MNEMELNADDIFGKKVSKVADKVEKQEETQTGVPLGFIPVNFSCEDKLGVSKIHVRNYSMEELLELAITNEENQFNVLIKKVLNNMIYEKIDASTFHAEQIKQILFTVYLNFWGKTLYKVPYYADEEKQKVAYEDIDITRLNTIQINKKFKEPFSIKDDNNLTVKFILPRINHIFLTDAFIKEYFKEEENKFSKIKKIKEMLEKLEEKQDSSYEKMTSLPLTEEEDKAYEEFKSRKGKMYFIALEAQLIHSVNGKVLETLDEKIDAFRKLVPIDFWFQYKDTVEKFATFGIDHNYTFKNAEDETITRRFSFRFTDFIPSVEQKTDRKYDIQFDD